MRVTVEIPDELAGAITAKDKDPARAVLEAIALEAYRKDWLSEAGIRRLLGFATRMQVHGFLKEHNVYLHYTVADLEHDIASALESVNGSKAEYQNEPSQ